MIRWTIAPFLLALITTIPLYADIEFNIRYYNKKIYYTDDDIFLKLTLKNTVEGDNEDASFYLADDHRISFGFEMKSLKGESNPLAEGYTAALNDPGAYRVVTLGPGKELSFTVSMADWFELSTPGQYRVSGFFYPALRNENSRPVQTAVTLDLTLLPDRERTWEDELDESMKEALRARNLEPSSVVYETLENRRDSKFNRAILYMDIDALANASRPVKDPVLFKKRLLNGSWDFVNGLATPPKSWELISSSVFPSEAIVRIQANFAPQGELFEEDLRFYLQKKNGYWSIRRIETVFRDEADPLQYGALNLDPPAVIEETLQAATRGDWEIALRYINLEGWVRNLPENVNSWKNMSASEHESAIETYKRTLISGKMKEDRSLFPGIGIWEIRQVSYTGTEGNIVIDNVKDYQTLAGTLTQNSQYTFKLTKGKETGNQWVIHQYTVKIIREEGKK